ncbi:MAG TPA: LysM domain-containing protein, partial [Sphingomicrobium sp.]
MRAGETLSSIAAQLWGDSNLWYKLAEANGLSSASALVEGQRLTVPAGVLRSAHNASTLTPYDPAETLGDVSPTTHIETSYSSTVAPQPRKGNKCGTFGVILLIAVAVAVTVVTSGALAAASISAATGSSVGLGAGITAALGGGGLTTFGMMAVGAAGAAAGSIVSQGLGVATGIQDKFSWKGVAMAAIGGGVGGGLGNIIRGGGLLAAAARGAIGSAFTQGIGVVTGLQQKFDFAGVAAAAVGSMAGSAFKNDVLGVSGRFAMNAGGYAMAGATGAAGAIANAATRSLIDGSSFGDNVMRSLPDVIGSTLGNMIADGIAAMAARPAERAALQRATAQKNALSDEFVDALAAENMRLLPTKRGLRVDNF